MVRLLPGSTRTDTLFPYTTLFRSLVQVFVFDRDCRLLAVTAERDRPYRPLCHDLAAIERAVCAMNFEPGERVPSCERIMELGDDAFAHAQDRKSTRLNSSH